MAYDATYALAHLIRTQHVTATGRYDATTALAGALKANASGTPFPTATMAIGSSAKPEPVATVPIAPYAPEKPKGKDKDR